MSPNENEEKPDKAGLTRDDVKGVVREVLSEAVVPKGYTRCSKCGDLVKEGKTCPCGNAAPDADNDDGSLTLLD